MIKEKGKRKKEKVVLLAGERRRSLSPIRSRTCKPTLFTVQSLLFLFSFFLFPFSLARGALDPESDKPYHLQVVLRIAENRLLTPVFQDLVQRQLRDSLQAALGDLAIVEVVRQHPLLKEVEARGLQAALDGYSGLSDTKTHFVLIDFVNGRYEIQARQHDGFTGLSSPVVRHSSTTDRQLVARSAALLIDQDFGLAGTVEVERIEGDKVNVKIKGGSLGVPLGHWVQKDQVFAVTLIRQGGGSSRMHWTLLQVLEEPRDGVCRCLLLHRKENPLPRASSVLGYRCLKLGTTQTRLRLRLVKDDKTPASGVQVLISAPGFEAGSGPERTSTKLDGLVESATVYKNVAYVQLYDVSKPLARVPVEIIEDMTITCPVSISAATTAQGELLHRRERWVRHVSVGLEVAASLFQELSAMQGQSSESALARAQKGLEAMQMDISNLTEERESLCADAARELPNATPLDLTEGERRLTDLQKRRDELQQFIGELQKIITEEKDPRRQKWKEMAAQAALQEGEAEFDKAIELYERVLTQAGDNPQWRAKLDTLKRAWAPKSEAHRKARAFIYETWPKQETAAQMKARLDEARKAFRICVEAGDVLSPRKLLRTYVTHAARLNKEVDALRPQGKEDDRKTAETIIVLTEELKKFNEEVKEYLSKATLPGK